MTPDPQYQVLPGIEIRPGTQEDFPRLAPLWKALFEHQRANGMLIELPEDAFEKWAASLSPVLERFACLYIAEADSGLVGFIAGRIRALPPYFGGHPTGFISDVFVAEVHRGAGIGRELMKLATAWFMEQKVTRIELQVIAQNDRAR